MNKNMRKMASPEVPGSKVLMLSDLSRRQPTPFDHRPEQSLLSEIAGFLDLLSLDRLRFKGQVEPWGADGWRLHARLTARGAQACVVSLEPVPEKIDSEVVRCFLPRPLIDDTQTIDLSLDDEDDPDPVDDRIDVGAVAVEELSLALNSYPRAEDAEIERPTAEPPGAAMLTEASLKPFASLADLKQRMERGNK